jgi:flagellar protein FlgJ
MATGISPMASSSSVSFGPAGTSAADLIKNNVNGLSKLANTSGKLDPKAKARSAAVDFEAVFLNSMFQQMFSGLTGEGPFGGDGATGVWRSFLTDEYSKSFAKAGGIGIADQVYASLLKQQEIHQ